MSKYPNLSNRGYRLALVVLCLAALLSACRSAFSGNLLANGNLDSDDFGLIPNWAETQNIDLSRWYLVQDVPPGAGAENVRWIERVDLSADGRGFGLKSTDYQNCDYFCSVEAVQIIPAGAGKTYTLSADLRSEQGAAGSLYLDFLSGSRMRIEVFRKGLESETWGSVTVTGQAPEGTQYVRIFLYSGNATQGVIYWDNVSLTLTNP